MNKSVKRVLCLMLSALTVGSLAACGGGGGGNGGGGSSSKAETRPVVFSTEPLDGTFNPFFATSASDVEILSLTQISMLGVTTDKNGNAIVACGQDEATVVDSYTITEGPDQAYTDYSFVIKNGIKFSDGSELTIKDVLFNLYVYLDPAYMGSATIYSTDIVGLDAYRAQDPSLLESDSGFDSNALNQQFYNVADTRIQHIIDSRDDKSGYIPSAEEEKEIEEDITRLKELFKEEVKSDWSSNAGTQTSYETEYTLKENWEIYFFVEGLASTVYYSTENGQKALKDKDGKYVTTLTKPGAILEDGTEYDGTYQGQPHYAEHIVQEIEAAAADEDAIAAKMVSENCTREEAIEYVIQDQAIKMVYDAYTTDVYLEQILLWWASGDKLREELMAKARTAYYDDLLVDGLKVKTISGITQSKTKDGKNDVLNIRINGVDPKAIWNFGFTVAPMYYYSDAETIESTDYGVKWGDFKFFNETLQNVEKNGLPVGAGPYMATNQSGSDNTDKDGFYKNNFVYYKRNPYFETVGKGINNAKIKYLRYKVVNSDQIVPAMQKGEIDIGEPNATATNIETIGKAGLDCKTVATNGYGYVGINPTYVPDIEVRRAIMYAMDTSYTIGYYTDELAELVFRSMSRESWAYPEDAESPYYDTSLATKEFLQDLVGQAGWEVGSGGKLYKEGKKLELTFTIAGGSKDHPAYSMFEAAQELLEEAGFTITIQRDPSALINLTKGKLAVWAAAWSSTVDPDMYQVYHKDSNATSTKNWGYDTIFKDQTGQFAYEQSIINELSDLIEEARETTVQSKRAKTYAEALDLVMELAVELPTYQRNDCVAYNAKLIDKKSLNQNPSPFSGVIDRVWELDYVD